LYSFGAAFVPFYRLIGPYKSEKAPQVVRTEIWETITRRGIGGNILMGVIPMAFYAVLNLLAWVAERVWLMVGGGNKHTMMSHTNGNDTHGQSERKKMM
jgi:dimethylaniline monooxygenase (N-oxide forming)